jgi:hypothetical protein
MSSKSKPSIEEIVKKRIKAGISGSAEYQLYTKGDLVDSDYTDEFKRNLLSELRKAQKKQMRREATQ